MAVLQVARVASGCAIRLCSLAQLRRQKEVERRLPRRIKASVVGAVLSVLRVASCSDLAGTSSGTALTALVRPSAHSSPCRCTARIGRTTLAASTASPRPAAGRVADRVVGFSIYANEHGVHKGRTRFRFGKFLCFR